MKNSNKAMRFWTLNRHHADGFTLVELIVVIAILAILAGVGIPVYSGYVTRANKQADINLANDVAQALSLAFYNQKLTKGMVVLTKDGVKTDEGALSAESQAALEAAFGSVSAIPGLKYNGWNGEYDGGSFQGNEVALVQKVEGLTTSLGEFLKDNQDNETLLNGRFGDYMKDELGFTEEDLEDTAKVADAAVLYVAHVNKNLPADKQATLENLGSCENFGAFVNVLVNDIYEHNLFVGTAAAYAMLTGYCQANGIPVGEVDPDLAGTNFDAMAEMLTDTFNEAINDEDFDDEFADYLKGQGSKDAAAFLEVMRTVDGAKGLVTDSLGTENCFSTAELEKVIQYFSAGNIVVLAETSNGKLEITVVPGV